MKIAMFTDIHFGARGNSEQHLQDCLQFIDWFCENCRSHGVEGIVFLGDWFENRESIMLHTLQTSHEAASKLNDLGIPVWLITGNHDLRLKSSREIASTILFSEFDNFTVVKDDFVTTTFGTKSAIICPFFMPDEYAINSEFINRHDFVFGHFEFKGFVVTGKTVTLDHGPEHQLFSKPKFVFSGHFHKRQIQDNVVYIGNPFPTNYGDVMDNQRGMCILDTEQSKISFINFQGPSFFYASLMDLLEQVDFPPKSNVKCYVDVDIPYSEIQELRKTYIEEFNLREFIIEDNFSAVEMARQDGVVDNNELFGLSLTDAVIHTIENKMELLNSSITKAKLVDMFKSLKNGV